MKTRQLVGWMAAAGLAMVCVGNANAAITGTYVDATLTNTVGLDAIKVDSYEVGLRGQVNSDIRYNFYYPRWAYDQYRQYLADASRTQGYLYLDLWDAVPSTEFTNTAIHLTPQGSALLAGLLGEAIIQHADSASY